jgi:hypothetical protein
MGLKKIISGGQTGADIAGIDAAIEHGLSYGGWLPKGRKTEKGALDLKYTNMTEMSVGDYQEMTEQNIKDSDGTVIFTHGKYSGVSALTINYAVRHNKPFLHLDLDVASESTAIESLIEWIYKHKIETLNVAGSRESKDENIYDDVHSIIMSIINTIRTAEILQKPQPPPAIKPSFQETAIATPQVITEEVATGREEIEGSDDTSSVSGLASLIERLPKIVQKNLIYISLTILLLTTAIIFLPGILTHYSSESTPTKSLPLPEGRDSKTTGLSSDSIPPAGRTPEPAPQSVPALPTTTNPAEQPGIQPLPSHPKSSVDSQAELSKTNPDIQTDNPSVVVDQPEKAEKDAPVDDSPKKTDSSVEVLNTPIESLSDTSGETEKTETSQVPPKKGPSKSQYRCGSLYKKISLGKVLDQAETDFLTHNCN